MPRLIQLDELSFGEPIAYKANMKRHFEHCNGARELSVCGNRACPEKPDVIAVQLARS